MRVVIDGRMLRSTGIGRYVSELVERVPALDPAGEYVVMLRADDIARWEPPAPNVRAVEADWGVYSWRAQVHLPRLLRRLRPDVVHFPHFAVPLLGGDRRVVTIQDLTLVDHRNVRSSLAHRAVYPLKQVAMVRTLRAAVSRSAALITSTAYVRDQLVQRFAGLDPAAVTVTPYGVPLPPRPAVARTTRTPVGGPYLLHVGNFYPYKNLDVLVDALVHLRRSHPALRVVLVGARDEFADRVGRHAERTGVADAVVFTGFVDDDELTALYAGASLFVFPSLSEGFGFPGLEAMAHGVPVAAARASCLPETYGDAAAWFDPRDAGDVARVIGGTLDDADTRARLVAAGRRRVAELSWERTAQQTLDVYRRVAATPSSRRSVVASPS